MISLCRVCAGSWQYHPGNIGNTVQKVRLLTKVKKNNLALILEINEIGLYKLRNTNMEHAQKVLLGIRCRFATRS